MPFMPAAKRRHQSDLHTSNFDVCGNMNGKRKISPILHRPVILNSRGPKVWLVSWSLTSLFSTNTAIPETRPKIWGPSYY